MTRTGAVAYIGGVVGPVNPGGACGWGYALYLDGVLLKDQAGMIEPSMEMTTAVAEYVAAGMALRAYLERAMSTPLVIVTCARQVVMQMQGSWKVREGPYVPFYNSVRSLTARCPTPVRWEQAQTQEDRRGMSLARFALQGAILGARSV